MITICAGRLISHIKIAVHKSVERLRSHDFFEQMVLKSLQENHYLLTDCLDRQHMVATGVDFVTEVV
jgi:hypothetical protein